MITKQTLSADIDAFVQKTEQRMLVMMRYALGDMVEDMQKPVAKGGRMRVDTGFLRASGRASLEGFPSGNGNRPSDAPVGQYTGIYDDWDGSVLNAALSQIQMGDTFYFGWVANYAEHRELFDGFMAAPIQDWQRYVDAAVSKVKQDVKDSGGA